MMEKWGSAHGGGSEKWEIVSPSSLQRGENISGRGNPFPHDLGTSATAKNLNNIIYQNYMY